LAFTLDGLPRPTPSMLARPAAPDPAALLLLPPLADQWLGEAIVVLGKVISEAALHAGGALVGCIELDVRGGDAHDVVAGDVQVHLAADAAVRADGANRLVRVEDLPGRKPLARNHPKNPPRRPPPPTLPAPRTPPLARAPARPAEHL